MHGAQHGYLAVEVVVDADCCLAFSCAHESSGVLDEAALERDGERQEEGVELRRIEAFAEVLAGRDNGELLPGWAVLGLLDDRARARFPRLPSRISGDTPLARRPSASRWQCSVH